MNKKDGVSIIIPAYNEEGNLEAAVKNAISAVSSVESRWEIIIVDDGSNDGSDLVGRKLRDKNRFIQFVRRNQNGGLGEAFKTGLKQAKLRFVTWFPGDNDTSKDSLRDLLISRKDADLIATYTVNPWTRSRLRRFISWGFTAALNTLFGFGLRYYNGCFIAPTNLVKSIKLISTGHVLFAELKVRLLAKGVSCKEIPFYHAGRKTGSTTAFRFKNIVSTIRTIWSLIWDI